MENRKNILLTFVTSIVILLLLSIVVIRKPYDMTPPPITTCKEDSLINVINDLKSELKIEEDGWDVKENRYEDILFEYEYGLNHLKESHPNAYREFHRIIGYRERYSHQIERENKVRLKLEK